MLAISIAFVARYGLRCVPPISRGLAGATGIQSGLIVMLALYVLTLPRAATDHASASLPAPRIAQA